MSDLPISESIRLRPVYRRYLKRKHHMPLRAPSDEERSDAIKVLRECYPPVWEIDELLLVESERIFAEASIEAMV